MTVRKLKCPQCGSIKMNELTTGYIYCDFCSALMGYDMKNIHDESKEAFAINNLSKPLQTSYIRLVQTMAEALNAEDRESYIDCQVKLKEIEFDLFPKRFSPKAKQKAYRQKQIEYTKAYWTELLENDYFSKSKAFRDKIAPLAQNLTSRAEGTKVYYEFNDAFLDYLKATDEYTQRSVRECLEMKSMDLYPEIQSPSFEILYKQSIDAALQMFDEHTVQKAVEYLNLETEYITIDDIDIQTLECIVCGHQLKVPDGSKAMLCETCGNVNDFIEKNIQCISCGAPVNFSETNSCEYCGAVHLAFSSKEKKKTNKTSMKKGGFLSKFFGS